MLEEGKVFDRSDKEWKIEREIRKITMKACKRLREEFEVAYCQEENIRTQRSDA